MSDPRRFGPPVHRQTPPGMIAELLARTARLAAILAAVPVAALVLAATLALPLAAQQADGSARSWRAGFWLGGGQLWSAGHMAKHSASDNPNLALLEVVSDLNPARTLGGGIELHFPAREIRARLGIQHSLGAEASGSIAICELFSGGLCEPITVPVTMRAATASVRLLTGASGQRLRPLLSAGLGVRDFEYEPLRCPPLSGSDESLVCEAVANLFREPAPHLVLQVGAGFEGGAGPLNVALEAIGTTASYQGGADRTDGAWYHTLYLGLTTSLAVY